MAEWKKIKCIDNETQEVFDALINFDNVVTVVASDDYEGYTEILTVNDYMYISIASVDEIARNLNGGHRPEEDGEPMLVKLKPSAMREIIAEQSRSPYGHISLKVDPDKTTTKVAKIREKNLVNKQKGEHQQPPKGDFIWIVEQEPTDGKARWVTLERRKKYGHNKYMIAYWGTGEGMELSYEEAEELTQGYTGKTLLEHGEKP